MKHELVKHLTPLIALFVVTSLYWIFIKTPWYQFVFLFSGLLFGSFLLDIDHLIYWYYTHPQLEESKLARITIKKKDYLATLKLLESTHKSHTDLLFHHIIFQLVLLGVSLFVMTSSNLVFGKALLIALNIHLLLDEYEDFELNKTHLQTWLFARLSKQIPQKLLGKYLLVIAIITAIFCLLLIRPFL